MQTRTLNPLFSPVQKHKVQYYQSLKLHNALSIQMLHHITFENVPFCHNIFLLHTYVTL